MRIIDFLKPNNEKVIITIFSYGLFYVFDTILRGPVEVFYTPNIYQQFLSAPYTFWIFRFLQEIIAFYIIASFFYWFLNLKSYKSKINYCNS